MPHSSIFSPVASVSSKLIPGKRNLHFAPMQYLISPLTCVPYLPFNCNQGKAGCMLCINIVLKSLGEKKKRHRFVNLRKQYSEQYQ